MKLTFKCNGCPLLRRRHAQRLHATPTTQAGRDYTGGLRLRFGLRLTDRYNLPAPRRNRPGTVSDTSIEAT